MFDLDLYFDRRIGDVLMLDPERLVPPDPDASWLLRETADGWTQGRRLERARADLDRLRNGWLPTDDVLAAAPVLTDWRIVLAGGSLALEGTVAGHPGIGEARRVLTSVLIAFDVAREQWGRTVSRFYLLGGRHPAG